MRYWVRNLDLARFELWKLQLDGGQFSDTLTGWISLENLDRLSGEQVQGFVVKTFGVPLPDDFVPSE